MRIVKIGTFNTSGMPTGWVFDCENANASGCVVDVDDNLAALSIVMDKVLIRGVEMVELTALRNECMRQ